MEGKWFRGISIVLCAILLGGCGKPITLGLVMDLSGRASELGVSARNGAQLAQKEINAAGGIRGRSLEFLIKDDKGLSEQAVIVDGELVAAQVPLVIGHTVSGTQVAGLSELAKANIPCLSPTVSAETLTGKDDNFFRVIDSNRKQGIVLADAALAEDKAHRVAILFERNNAAYTKDVCSSFQERYEAGGGKTLILLDFVSGADNSFADLAKQLTDSGADQFLLVCGGLDLGVLVQKIKQNQPEASLFAGMWGMTPDVIRVGGKASEGIHFPGVFDNADTGTSTQAFLQSYRTTFGAEPTFSSVYTYEAVKLAAEALRIAKSLSVEDLREAMLKTGTIHGIQGDFSLDRFGDANRGYYLFVVDKGAFKRVK